MFAAHGGKNKIKYSSSIASWLGISISIRNMKTPGIEEPVKLIRFSFSLLLFCQYSPWCQRQTNKHWGACNKAKVEKKNGN